MIKTWGKLIKRNRLSKHYTVITQTSPTTEDNLEEVVEQLCYKLDIPRPLILSKNIKEMRNFGQTRFLKDDFMETLPYDKFELEILKEDKKKR